MRRLSARRLRIAVTLTAVAAAFVVFPVSSPTASATTPWTLAQVSSPAGGWSLVDYLNGQWIAFSHAGELALSSDGSTWTEQPAPVGSWQAAAYGAGRYVVLSSADAVPNEMTSTDGAQWSTLPGPPSAPLQASQPVQNGQWSAVAFGSGLFVAVSSLGTVATSSDGVTWTQRFWRPQDNFTSITYGDGRFIAVDGAEGDVLMSLDGLHWSLIRQPLTGLLAAPTGGLHFGAVAYGDGNFVAFGSQSGSGYVATSVYGYAWALHQYSPAQGIDGATFGCGSFVAAGQSTGMTDPLISSTTGAAWVAQTVATGTASNWTAVAYGAGRYVAVDAAGDVASSLSGAECANTVPSSPQQVSGNVHNGEVWTYMHPSASPGGAKVEGYRVTITDGVTTRYCNAPVYFEPNCIIKGLRNHTIYWVTAQARNRFGYSAPTDPEFVIPVAAWRLDAAAPSIAPTPAPAVVQITGIIANAAGFYPWTTVSIHVGSQLLTCRPSPFGECVITVADPPVGTVPIYVTYSGYGRSYRSPTREVTVSSVSVTTTTTTTTTTVGAS